MPSAEGRKHGAHLRSAPGCWRAMTRSWISASSSKLFTRLALLLRERGSGGLSTRCNALPAGAAAFFCTCLSLLGQAQGFASPSTVLRHLARLDAPVKPTTAAIRLKTTSMPAGGNGQGQCNKAGRHR